MDHGSTRGIPHVDLEFVAGLLRVVEVEVVRDDRHHGRDDRRRLFRHDVGSGLNRDKGPGGRGRHAQAHNPTRPSNLVGRVPKEIGAREGEDALLDLDGWHDFFPQGLKVIRLGVSL